MRFILDLDLFHKWRKLAVTQQEDMAIGQHFWCTDGKDFTLAGWTGEPQYTSRTGMLIPGSFAMNIAVSAKGAHHRLNEMNVDTHDKTPWLLFRDPATCRACQLSLPVIIDNTP